MSRRGTDGDTRGLRRAGRLTFSGTEIRDLLVAWVALSAAFALFFAGGGTAFVDAFAGGGGVGRLATLLGVSLVTAGVAFLLHELGHKVLAVRYGQRAEFRADYGMLFLAVVAATAGFLFAAPGAVHHAGRLTEREHGLIALAGPVVNLGLAAVFAPLLLGGGLVGLVGTYGVAVNLLLAAFNMIPFGPLDGATVRSWSTPVWAGVFLPSAALAVVFALGVL